MFVFLRQNESEEEMKQRTMSADELFKELVLQRLQQVHISIFKFINLNVTHSVLSYIFHVTEFPNNFSSEKSLTTCQSDSDQFQSSVCAQFNQVKITTRFWGILVFLFHSDFFLLGYHQTHAIFIYFFFV